MKRDVILLTILSMLAMSTPGSAQAPPQAAASPTSVSPPTGERDLVVFVARWRPELFRLVGQQPVPYGTARFTSPRALVADPAHQCFYVFDEPSRLDETRKIWRIDGQGNPTLVFQGHLTTHGGPFGKPTSLGLDPTGQLLVADAVTGLWRLEGEGRIQRLVEGKDKPLFKITAVTSARGPGLIVGTSYMHEVTGGQMLNLPERLVGKPLREFNGMWTPTPSYGGLPIVELDGTGVANSTGRQVPIRVWRNQGGLYQVEVAAGQVKVQGLLVNQKPGGADYDTYWQTLSQVFLDTAGRLVLVDAGSTSKREEEVYIRPGRDEQAQSRPKRTTTSIIRGGLILLHADGRLEDLTFKTPDQSSGPLRQPVGAAQWSDDTYIVADPELYVSGINGTGGLLLLKLDGSREARWPFGYQIKPAGVAILRGAGSPAAAQTALPISTGALAGTHTAGPILRIESVALERKPEGGGGPLGSIVIHWDRQSAAEAEQRLRAYFEGARWSILPDGVLHFSAKGVAPQQEGTPWVMVGKVTVLGQIANASASYQRKTAFDAQIGSLDARLLRGQEDSLTMNVTVNVFTNTERLKATFEQTMPLPRR